MASKWTNVSLGEVAQVVGGGTPSTAVPELWGGDVAWLTPKDLSGNQSVYVTRGERNISERGLKESSAKMLPPGAVLFSSRAPIGYVAIARGRMCTNQGFKSLVLKEGHDSRFYYYLLQYNKDAIEALAGGSTFKEVSGGVLGQFRVKVPSPKEQVAIASVLGALDDRIENLRATNEALEAIVQTLFRSWFVDFDPVKAKAEGKVPVGMDEETAKLFPREFEEPTNGSLPLGWAMSTVGAVFSVTMGQSPPGSTYNQEGIGLPFFQGSTDFGLMFPQNRVFCIAPTRHAKEGDTLVSVRAPVGTVNIALENCSIGRGVASIRHGSCGAFAYAAMKALKHNFATFEADGTVFGSINKGQLLGLPMLDPPVAVINAFERSVGSLLELIREGELESRRLCQVRNELLPKLISGELRLPGFGDNAT